MIIYEELDLKLEHRTQFAFKSKGKPAAKANTLNMAYPN